MGWSCAAGDFAAWAIASSSVGWRATLRCLGKYCRISLLVFSTVGFCHGLPASVKKTPSAKYFAMW